MQLDFREWPLIFFEKSWKLLQSNFLVTVILEIFVSHKFRIIRKFLKFMKTNSLLISIPGLKCTVNAPNYENREVLQHVILAKKPYERRLQGAAPILYVILVRKPRNERPRYGLST